MRNGHRWIPNIRGHLCRILVVILLLAWIRLWTHCRVSGENESPEVHVMSSNVLIWMTEEILISYFVIQKPCISGIWFLNQNCHSQNNPIYRNGRIRVSILFEITFRNNVKYNQWLCFADFIIILCFIVSKRRELIFLLLRINYDFYKHYVKTIISSLHSEVIWLQWTWSLLVQVMVCRLFGAKAFHKSMLICCPLKI